MKKLLLSLILVVILLVVGWMRLFYETPCINPGGDPPLFEIPAGANVVVVGRLLESQHITEYGFAFTIGAHLLGLQKNLKAGEYLLDKTYTLADLLDLFVSGKTYKRKFTVVPGNSVTQILQKLEEAPVMTGTIQMKPEEGELFPETYVYSKGQDRQKILNQMKTAMGKKLQELWQKRDPAVLLNTPQEALILASIVEKESGSKDDPAVIASVFYNRLRIQMRLQSDPTVVYGITRGASKLDRPISKADLTTDTPFNTYTRAGLPPAPICNPSEKALIGVLHPASTDYLYFVADGKGGHTFAKNLEDHSQNHAAWRQLRAQGNRNVPVG